MAVGLNHSTQQLSIDGCHATVLADVWTKWMMIVVVGVDDVGVVVVSAVHSVYLAGSLIDLGLDGRRMRGSNW